MSFRKFAMVALACALLLAGCRHQDKRYKIHGQVLEKNMASNEITIKHDEIPGFMAAMTWGFMKSVAEGTGEQEFKDYIDQCLLLRSETGEPCIDRTGVATVGYDELIGTSGVYLECRSNWNNCKPSTSI